MQLPEYDVVIATRNRATVLPISIPTMLGQSIPPKRLIVVDSSDDPAPVRKAVELAATRFDVPVTLVRSERGATRQRNLGLDRVDSPVVFFPDDDSLWHPGSAHAVLRIYARDRAGYIGGVCAAQAAAPPPGALDDALHAPYTLRWSDRLKNRFSPLRSLIEHAIFPDPFILHGRHRIAALGTPDWLAAENAVPVEWMTGFRMTLRTDVARRCRWDETFVNYSTFDDIELCFNVLRSHLLVGARNAKVFHYRDPRARSVPANMGLRHIVDRAYIIRKYAAADSPAPARLAAYNAYKIAQYTLAAACRGGWDRVRGALAGMRHAREIARIPDEQLADHYARICTR